MHPPEALRNMVRVERIETHSGFRLASSRGQCEITLHAPGVLEARYTGHAVDEFFPPIGAVLDGWVRDQKRVTVAVDAYELASYTTGYRTAWTDWLWRHRAHLRSVPALFRSPIIEMGVKLVARVVGNTVTAHARPSDYRREVDHAVAEARAGR